MPFLPLLVIFMLFSCFSPNTFKYVLFAPLVGFSFGMLGWTLVASIYTSLITVKHCLMFVCPAILFAEFLMYKGKLLQ